MKTIKELETEEYGKLGCGRAIVRHEIKVLKEVLELIDELKDVVKWKCGTNTDNAMFWNEEIEELKARITG